MRAAEGGHNETVQTLIAAGADLNIQSFMVYSYFLPHLFIVSCLHNYH